MTCRKIRKLVPLAAGNDLRPRQARAFRTHLEACPGCRAELEAFRRGLAEIEKAARAEGAADWAEAEWAALMTRVATQAKVESGDRSRGPVAALRPQWAAAAAVGVLLGLVVMGALVKGPSLWRGTGGKPGLPAMAAGAARPEQDKMSITMVSPESGLQVVWILDKNFEWKGDRE
jgi:anti-sigma factor RsiW